MKSVYKTLIYFLYVQLHVALCEVSFYSHNEKDSHTNEPVSKMTETIKWPFSETDFQYKIQSPVDVILKFIKERPDLPPLKIHEPLHENVNAEVLNNGKTVGVYIKEDNIDQLPFLVGGPLKEGTKYLFEQMHFHWGKHDEWGSEHFINGEAFSVEIHMVYFNNKHKDFKTAVKQHDGLAVLTIFAEIDSKPNILMDPLHKTLLQIQKPDQRKELQWEEAMSWAISGMKVNEEYYTYPGSLTTEPHSQNVAFILLPKPITLSHDQLQAFRNLKDKEGHPISHNKRKVHPLNKRPIFKGHIKLELDKDGKKRTRGFSEKKKKAGRFLPRFFKSLFKKISTITCLFLQMITLDHFFSTCC